MTPPSREMVERAKERFEALVEPEPNSGCWLWIGALRGKGYGSFWFAGAMVQAHRFAYELYRGPLPLGLVGDHKCRVRICVNPWHVNPTTNQDNVLSGIGVSALNARKTHCPKGHEYTEANTRIYGRDRHCRRCAHEYGHPSRGRA